MTLKQLEGFYLAANLGSFALAAQRLHVTQSSLSKRVAELEAAVGCELFDRSSKRAQLTEAGRRLIPVIARMLELKDAIRDAARSQGPLTGTCRFGISELGALTWLPRFVATSRKEYPQLLLHPHVDLSRALERQVSRGELDFAVVAGPPEDSRLTAHTVGQVPFAWMASPSRFPRSTVLTAAAMQRHPVITMTEDSKLRRAFDAWASEQTLHPQRIVESNSLMAIVGLTIADVGISYLPRDFARPWLDRGALVALRSRPPLPGMTHSFVHRADDHRATVSAMLACVAAEATFALPAGFFE